MNRVFDKVEFNLVDDNELTEDERKEKENLMIEKLRRFNAPDHWTLENFKMNYWIDGFQAVHNFLAGSDNLFLSGQSGSGKSWLACAAGVELIKKSRTVYRLNEVDLRQEWLANISRFNDKYYSMIKSAKDCDVLIFDELGKNKLAEDKKGIILSAFGGAVFPIFDFRYENQLQTIITTQHTDPNDITKLIGDSIYRRAIREYVGESVKCIFAARGEYVGK